VRSSAPTAVESTTATTVETATAVVGAGCVAMRAATRVTTVISAADVAACRSAAIVAAIDWAVAVTVARPAISITRPIAVSGSITIPGVTIVAVSIVAAAIPWAGTDEQAAYEPVRAVVTVGRAGVGIIPVVTIRADGSRANARVNRANANSHGDLGMRCSGGKDQNPQQCCIV
jgi:hypothetical protein